MPALLQVPRISPFSVLAAIPTSVLQVQTLSNITPLSSRFVLPINTFFTPSCQREHSNLPEQQLNKRLTGSLQVPRINFSHTNMKLPIPPPVFRHGSYGSQCHSRALSFRPTGKENYLGSITHTRSIHMSRPVTNLKACSRKHDPQSKHKRHISSTAVRRSLTALPQILINDMTNQELLVDFNGGTAMRFPSFWLRDHCPCPACQHPSTHQRLLDTFALDPEIKVSSVESTPEGLYVTWPASAGHDTHESTYPWEWLSTHPPFAQPSSSGSQTAPVPQREWIHIAPNSPNTTLPRVSYDSITSSSSTTGLKHFLSNIHTYGLCFIPSTPDTPSATQSLVESIAHIRATHYGGFWDFTSEVNPIDTAYTNDYLPPHTDTTYFTDPAGLQLFHCLSHTSLSDPNVPGKGGESTFVDGFAAASHLYTTHPDLYHTLATYPILAAAQGDIRVGSFYNNASSQQGFPVFIHSAPTGSITSPSPSTLVQIRWNNLDRLSPSRPVFPNHTALKKWYTAAREWNKILASPEFLLTVKLQPGEPVIFDNWRVLHGRLGFEGKRRICGAYVGMDDFRAKCRSLDVEV